MHDWKPGDKAMVEVEIVSKWDDKEHVYVHENSYIHFVVNESNLLPITPDWREKYEDKDKDGEEVIYVDEQRNYYVCFHKGCPTAVRRIDENLIPKRPPESEKKLRPWKAEEARGKWVRNKRNKSISLIIGISELGFFLFDCLWWKPQEMLDEFEQLDGTPAGTLE